MKIFTYALVRASKGNPVLAVATILLFYVFFNLLEAMIETLIFGDRFEHWLDPIFIAGFIVYSGYTVWLCATYNTIESKPN